MPSTPQVIATATIFDYEVTPQGLPLADQEVIIHLASDAQSVISPAVDLSSTRIKAVTDANGYWSAALIPNTNITPANTLYSVHTPGGRTYEISVGGAGGQATTLIVNAPTTLPPGSTVLAGPLDVGGLFRALGGLTVAGAISLPAGSIPYSALTGGPTDALLLHKALAEAITGIKTFTADPVFNAGGIAQASVAGLVAALTGLAHLTGAEAFTGAKTFTVNPVFNAGAIPDAALASTFLKNLGAVHDIDSGSSTRTNSAYGNLASGAGPTVTVTTGTQALVIMRSRMTNDTAADYTWMGYTVSGASTIAASDARAAQHYSTFQDSSIYVGLQDGLTPGSNVFTAAWRCDAAAQTMTARDREIIVIPFI